MIRDNTLFMIKFGGSLITDKRKPYTVKKNILKRLVKELSELHREGYKILLGHGGGSFPHTSAKKFKTNEGFIHKDSKIGMSIVHYDAARLNMIVMKYLIDSRVEAYPLQASSIAITSDDTIREMYLETLKHLLRHRIVPVIYGDVGLDIKKGCTIISTEELFRYIALELKNNYKIKIIMCEAVDGVFDKDPMMNKDAKLIPLITKDNIDVVLNMVSESYGIDVTGGMRKKVEKLYSLALQGIESIIINGRIRGRLIKAVKGERVRSTLIRA